MGLLSGIFGGSFKSDDAGYNAILAGPNRMLQEDQDEVLANPNVARLVSEEGRDDIFEGITNRLDSAYRNAMTLGTGGLSRAGLSGSSASTILRNRLRRDRDESVSGATTQSNVASGQFVSQLFGDFRKEHIDYKKMKLQAWAGKEDRRLKAHQSEQAAIDSMMQGAGMAIGGGAFSGFDITKPFGFDWVGM